MPPPGLPKISHEKDGCQRWLHRFYVSRPLLPSRWIRYCDPSKTLHQNHNIPSDRKGVRYVQSVANLRGTLPTKSFPISWSTRMHSSRMRTARLLAVSFSMEALYFNQLIISVFCVTRVKFIKLLL